MKKLLWISFVFVVRLSLSAQNINPGVDQIFRPDELAVIKLTLTPEDKAFLLAPTNINSEVYLKATFHMINSRMDTILQKQVGIRLRGNTSRGQHKKPFKIDFREFNGKKFFGYKKFNLKPNVNDPSQVREPLTLQYFREMNIPAARTHPLRLYMNDEYMGVYLNVEQIDDVFLTSRDGHEEGFLYKCTYGASLIDDGQVFNTTFFESELNETTDTRAQLNYFVHILNSTSNPNFSTEIAKIFNVDLYLRYLAVEALLGHWDGYSYNMNNYYLFYNGQKSKMEFLPYDTDNTWGIDWVGWDWGRRNLFQWSNQEKPRPLTTRILDVPEYRLKYKQYIAQLLGSYFKLDYVTPILNSYKTVLNQAVQDDTYFDDAFGFSYNHFLNSFSTGMNNHVKYGITEYLLTRAESANIQLSETITAIEDEQLVISNQIYPNPSRDPHTYYYSSTGLQSTPVVYSSTGVRMAIGVTALDDQHTEISLPAQAAHGFYIILIDGKVFKWSYQ